MNSTKAQLVKLFASGLYSGLSPTIPGTTGTLPALVLAWFVGMKGDNWMIVATVLMTIASVWLATEAEELFGHDSKKIVIDEWAGMFIALLFVPHVWTSYLLAFGAFRLLDGIKILGAAEVEKLPRGWGVTADDVVAGIQANLLTQLFVWVFPTIFAIGQV
jgi:phosphatidylglycerophosphatase A